METIKELEEERKNLIEKLRNIEKFIKENTNRDERGIFPKDKEKLLPKDYAGDDSIENLNPSCRACNFRKGSNNIEGFREELQHGLLCC